MNAKADDVRGTSIGYAINLTMDYGNGRQVVVSGTLPLNATVEEFNAEMDKIRTVTNRQQAFLFIRDAEGRKVGAEKSVLAIELMMEAYEKEMDEQIGAIEKGPAANHTRVKAQVEGMRAQAMAWKQSKREELSREESAVATCISVIAHYQKEIDV